MQNEVASVSLWTLDNLRALHAAGRLVVGTTSAYLNRTVDPANVARLARVMTPSGLSFSPIILAHFNGKFFIVDGTHRVIALVTPRYKLEERVSCVPVAIWNVSTEGDLYSLVARSQSVINDRRKHQQFELCMSAFSADLDGAEASAALLRNKPAHVTVDAWLKWFVLFTSTNFLGDTETTMDNNTYRLFRTFLATVDKGELNKMVAVEDFITHATVECKRYLPLLTTPKQLSVGLIMALRDPSLIRKPSVLTTYLKDGKRGIEQKFGVTKAGGAFQIWLCRAAQGKEVGV
jgi:hypothetical protein